ncbi:Prp18-domain-containing protein [Sistotremastrum niveocremeum HHB9708]|uniref:Pre-mRNA-splicing factor 18 n=1 Tax=Sistotremastrum niveocremeum HHB9708 TaxID=1314777 RepID=A0A164TH22_9AGAM|nr:Prp18-domain-containing protein [Sistotremastrum niveocremeum HHB9708]
MDLLKAELANKRKALESETADRPKKYLRRGEIERLKAEEERKAAEEKAKQAEEERRKWRQTTPLPASRSETSSPMPPSQIASTSKPETSFNISNEETILRLRAKGQPIRLFGETDKDRRLRLRALELIEEKGNEKAHGGQNDFKKALEDVEQREDQARQQDTQTKGKKKEDADQPVGPIDLDLIKTDPDKLYPLIYYSLRRTVKEWEEWMNERPEQVKRSTQGKLAAATQVQSAEYLKPLFKNLRSRSLPADVLARMAEIVHYMQTRQYQRANDAYLRLSIGNAPWPIGVTMVGIHERSAREKISSDQVAHVLNDEVSRKYIQSLKRLLTFSQTKYPPEDISQMMG